MDLEGTQENIIVVFNQVRIAITHALRDAKKIKDRMSNTGARKAAIEKYLEYLHHSMKYHEQSPLNFRCPFTGLHKKGQPEIVVPFTRNVSGQ